MTDVPRCRPLSQSERAELRRFRTLELELEKRKAAVIRDRDARLRAMRWGYDGRGPVAVRELRTITGLSRAHVNRIVGLVRDQRSHDEQELGDGTQ